jgi:hypothetical protein
MKNLILISVLVLTTISTVFSQSPDDYIDLDSLNYSMIMDGILKDLNSYRKSYGLPELIYKKVNHLASDYHTKYLVEYGEKNKIHSRVFQGVLLKTPQDRVNYYSNIMNEVPNDIKIRCSHYTINNYQNILDDTYENYNKRIVNYVKGFSEFYDSDTKYIGVSVNIGNIDLDDGDIFYTIVTGVILTGDSDSM